jgi:hypothetical protein
MSKIALVGVTPSTAANKSRTRKPIARSTRPGRTLASGMIRRGKYTFEIRLALPTRLPLAAVTAFVKYIHGSSPA